MTSRPIGKYDAVDAERTFAQQVRYTPFTSMANASGLPAISLPVRVTAKGLPMGCNSSEGLAASTLCSPSARN